MVMPPSEQDVHRREDLDEAFRPSGLFNQAHDHNKHRPADARRMYVERTGTDPDDALMNDIFNATLPCFTYDLSMTRWYYDQLGGWIWDRGWINAPEALVWYWANDLVISAREAKAHSPHVLEHHTH